MAEEKKTGATDDYQFTAPDFDETAFIHKEMVSFRTTVILFIWGIVAAAASWAAYLASPATGWLAGLAICAAFGLSLKLLFPRLGADIAHFKRREWMGVGFLFFFTWLSFFMVAINPPVTDVASPQVFLDTVPAQQTGSDVVVEMLATDNAGIASADLRIVDGAGNPVDATIATLSTGRLAATIPDAAAGNYRAIGTASDGRTADAASNLTFVVGNVLHPPTKRVLSAPEDFVVVTIDGQLPCTAESVALAAPCVRVVLLRPIDGSDAIVLEYNELFGGWGASSAFKGWKAGNNTVQVVAEFQERFLGAQRIPGGELVLETPVTITVANPTGTKSVELTPQPAARSVHVPGFEFAFAALAIVAVAAVVARRAKNQD
ncbi:MAG: hypothetical protein AABX89_00845 [Candidatus Thermoplasmatota archaeon]